VAVNSEIYYGRDLAWVHHAGYSRHVEQTAPGIKRILTDAGLSAGDRVLDVGCGSGLLARELLAVGFEIHGVDASEAMIELARAYAPRAVFGVVRLPSGLRTGAHGALPSVDAVVSTGHVLNYLDHRDDMRAALAELAHAIRPGGVLAMDLMTERFCEARDVSQVHAKVEKDWAIVTRFSRPERYRYDRSITTFRLVDGVWRRSDEYHRNVTMDVDDALRILRGIGVNAHARSAFGDENLPEGLVVLTGVRR
jgi:SAM-dependent methyltransferase